MIGPAAEKLCGCHPTGCNRSQRMSGESPEAILPDRPATGVEVITGIVKRLPNGPGVYRMIDAKGTVLYVGKARSLKKRVQSYTRLANQSGRIARAIQATASMEFVSTRTETE